VGILGGILRADIGKKAVFLGFSLPIPVVATGTGIAAEAAARIVGPSGSILATDISTRILEQARQRLAGLTNATFAVEDGQALSIPGNSVDAVLCSMGLMLFPDPALGLSEFRRVLRENGRAAVSVSTTPERSFVARVSTEIARHVPSRAPAAARFFSLGDANHLHRLFAAAGFRAIETATETRRFPFQSFDSWFDPIEKGEGNLRRNTSRCRRNCDAPCGRSSGVRWRLLLPRVVPSKWK
jgi:ubiquinone/menaquinone biosynthesis C-methylase UbiE